MTVVELEDEEVVVVVVLELDVEVCVAEDSWLVLVAVAVAVPVLLGGSPSKTIPCAVATESRAARACVGVRSDKAWLGWCSRLASR